MRRVAALAFVSAAALFAQISDKEMALGKQLLNDWGRKWKIVKTPDAVAALSRNLSAPRTVEVLTIESDQALANTLPGGIVYVSTALLNSATNAELAAVLAHEIAHTAAHHDQTAPVPMVFNGTLPGLCLRTSGPEALMPIGLKARFIADDAAADLLASHYLLAMGFEAAEVKPIFDRFQWVTPPIPARRKAPTLLR